MQFGSHAANIENKDYLFSTVVCSNKFNCGIGYLDDKITDKSWASVRVKSPEIEDLPPLIAPTVTPGAEYTISFMVMAICSSNV